MAWGARNLISTQVVAEWARVGDAELARALERLVAAPVRAVLEATERLRQRHEAVSVVVVDVEEEARLGREPPV